MIAVFNQLVLSNEYLIQVQKINFTESSQTPLIFCIHNWGHLKELGSKVLTGKNFLFMMLLWTQLIEIIWTQKSWLEHGQFTARNLCVLGLFIGVKGWLEAYFLFELFGAVAKLVFFLRVNFSMSFNWPVRVIEISNSNCSGSLLILLPILKLYFSTFPKS